MDSCSSVSTCAYTGLNFLADQSVFLSTKIFTQSPTNSIKLPLTFSVITRAISLPIYFMSEDVQEKCPNPINAISYVGLNGMLGAYISKITAKYTTAVSWAEKFISFGASNLLQLFSMYMFKVKDSGHEMQSFCDYSWKKKNVTYEKFYVPGYEGIGITSNKGYQSAKLINAFLITMPNILLLMVPSYQLVNPHSIIALRTYFTLSTFLLAHKITTSALENESKLNIGLKVLNSPIKMPVYLGLIFAKLASHGRELQDLRNNNHLFWLTVFTNLIGLTTFPTLNHQCAVYM